MHIHDVVQAYQSKTDEELLQLAGDSGQLTPEAHSALTSELAKRRINRTAVLNVQNEIDSDSLRQPRTSVTLSRPDSHSVGDFIAEVVRVYHSHFWLFVRLIAPAVVLGYIAILMSRNEVREIGRHLPRGVGLTIEILKMWMVTLAGYLVSWMAFSFSFGAICAATRQIDKGVVPSARACFGDVRQRLGSLARLSVLLLLLVLVALAASNLLGLGVFWVVHLRQAHPSFFAIQVVSYGLSSLALLAFSRFALAIPALILDNCTGGQAIFRSDELTEGKWLTLAILLTKSLIGGYIAGMTPFWLAWWLSGDVRFPSLLLRVASIAAVTVVEPVMFIGFALLYIRMSALPPASVEETVRQLA
jgi:hypothetical protein